MSAPGQPGTQWTDVSLFEVNSGLHDLGGALRGHGVLQPSQEQRRVRSRRNALLDSFGHRDSPRLEHRENGRGCALGLPFCRLRLLNPSTVALDPSTVALEKAREGQPVSRSEAVRLLVRRGLAASQE